MAANLTVEQLREWTRKELGEWPDQGAFAAANNISSAYFSDFLNGKREPGEKMLAALGFERVVRYRRKHVPE